MSDQSPIDILKEEMENDEPYLRINAIHRVKIIATILGVEGVKSQLLPYFESLIKKEEDEIQFAIAQEIENLIPMLKPQQSVLLPILENLACQEETVVRDKAIQTLIALSASLNDNEIQNSYIPLMFRLANNEGNFTFRIGSVHLMCNIYQRAGANKEKIRQKFTEFCSEETPMVRRLVAQKIGDFSQVLEKEFIVTEVIQNLKMLISDDQDLVRVLAINSLKQVAKCLNKDENKQLTLPIIIAGTEDKSWRVRHGLSKIFADIAEAFGKEVADVSLIQIFTNLLRDSENEVRSSSIITLTKFIKSISSEKLLIIVPHLQYIAKDSVPAVRKGVAEVIGLMSSSLPKDILCSKLLPHLVELFNDDAKEVRESTAKAASLFIQAAGADALASFLVQFKKSIEDPKWRVRYSTFEGIAELAKNFNNYDVFSKNLEPLFMLFLKDKCSTVRELCVSYLPNLIAIYKNNWVQSSLIPKLMESLNKDNGYLYRLTGLESLKQVVLSSTDQKQDYIIQQFYKHLSDPVPNIKIHTIKILKQLYYTLDQPSFKNECKQQVSQCLNDSDRDVKYFAEDFSNTNQ